MSGCSLFSERRLVINEVLSGSFGLVTEHCHYNGCQRVTVVIVECGIARFLCAMHVFDVRASSSSPRLPLCQISYLLQPPFLS